MWAIWGEHGTPARAVIDRVRGHHVLDEGDIIMRRRQYAR